MRVYRSGNVFSSARVTGPTGHFLSVEFDQSNEPFDFRVAETQKEVLDKRMIACLQRAMDDCGDMLPVHNRYNIKCLWVSQRDEPSEDAYRDLLREIIDCANKEIEA